MGVATFCADRRTDRYDEISHFRNCFADAPKMGRQILKKYILVRSFVSDRCKGEIFSYTCFLHFLHLAPPGHLLHEEG
jgi:hypothetical protein